MKISWRVSTQAPVISPSHGAQWLLCFSRRLAANSGPGEVAPSPGLDLRRYSLVSPPSSLSSSAPALRLVHSHKYAFPSPSVYTFVQKSLDIDSFLFQRFFISMHALRFWMTSVAKSWSNNRRRPSVIIFFPQAFFWHCFFGTKLQKIYHYWLVCELELCALNL